MRKLTITTYEDQSARSVVNVEFERLNMEILELPKIINICNNKESKKISIPFVNINEFQYAVQVLCSSINQIESHISLTIHNYPLDENSEDNEDW